MQKRTVLAKSLLLAFGGTAVFGGSSAFAQDATAPIADTQQLQRVEVTGSAIKRVATEGALPITVLTQADIQKSGATSITDLIQALPSMQNFVPASSSVNGGGGGVTTAALHSLPSKYTLVLLDGQRVAPIALGNSQGGGFGVNLESIPLSAVERVEILTDGASALYGSDAIAGVVNFILKKNKTDGDVTMTYNAPQHPGGGGWNVSVTKGFGDLGKDNYNVLFSLSHDRQDAIAASQRSFSSNGAYFPFSSNGKNYIFDGLTSNTEPANLTFNAVPTGSPTGTTPTAYSINPYYAKNGNCGSSYASVLSGVAALGSQGVSCRFNYAATVQDVPSSTRDAGLLKGTFNLNPDTTVWAEAALSEYKMHSQYAAAAQPLGISSTNNATLYNEYIAPYLAANNLTISGAGKIGYRSVTLGGRADEYKTDASHFSFGVDGTLKGWDYNASLTLSHSVLTDTAEGGYSDATELLAAVAAGTYDPVMATGSSSVSSAILHTQLEKSTSDLDTLHLGAQHDLFNLPGGMSTVAVGADLSRTHYVVDYSNYLLAQSGFSTEPSGSDFPIGGNYGQVPFDASRTNWGAFSEILLPVTKTLEVTGSVRYDRYSKTYSKYVFSTATDAVTGLNDQIGNAELGNTFGATTGKISLKYVPIESLLFRGSYGSGFKAPNISDIAGAVTYAGSTQGSYPCPFPGSAGCFPGSAQYDLLAGPNGLSGSAGLKPETSRQWTLGFRIDPVKSLSLGLDFWGVTIRNQVLSQGIAENVGFTNPSQYANLFVNPYADPAGFTTIAFEQLPFNGGQANYRGIDWDVAYASRFSFGNLTTRFTGTRMLKQEYNFGAGLPYNSDLGVFGPDQQVVFRTIMNLIVSLQSGPFLNSVSVHYKSGYRDESYATGTDVFLANPDGSLGSSVAFAGLNVPSYTTFDWQGKYDYNKAFSITVGIRNLFDRFPPLSLQSGGGGNAVGYDGRYTDPTGRTYYLSGQYKF